MSLRSVFILLLLIASLMPAYYANKLLHRFIRPRQSLGRLLVYMLSALSLSFAYTFLLVWILLHLFPYVFPHAMK